MSEIAFHIGVAPTATHQQKQVNWARRIFYEPQEVKAARASLMAHLSNAKPDRPLEGPLAMQVVFFFETADEKQDGQPKTTRPDLDNSVKLLLDCMTASGFWQDDAQITALTLLKFWGLTPGIWVKVKEVQE